MKAIRRVAVGLAALAMGACSFEVTNPGPVQDAALDDAGAYDAMVRGVRYNLSLATGINTFYSAVAAKEYSTSGRVNATKLPLAFGQLLVDEVGTLHWNASHAARWTAEDGVRRLREVLGAGFANSRHAGQLLMYGALANRLMGECQCQAVIDASAAMLSTAYLVRADSQATEAIAVATAAGDTPTANAARAIRASVRLHLGNFAGAGTDAAGIATSFVLTAPFDQTGNSQNILVSTNDAMPTVGGGFKAHTTWRTFFEGYYRTTGDLRVEWDSTVGAGGKAGFGEFTGIYWFYQKKYLSRGASIRLISGREMRLIEAEVALQGGNLASAMNFINVQVRQPVQNNVRPLSPGVPGPPLAPWPGTTLQEGWDALRKERSIELWLEGRTMGDLRRWIANGTYATYFANGGSQGTAWDVADRTRLCMPITRNERQTNSNLLLDPDDPVSTIFNSTIAPW